MVRDGWLARFLPQPCFIGSGDRGYGGSGEGVGPGAGGQIGDSSGYGGGRGTVGGGGLGGDGGTGKAGSGGAYGGGNTPSSRSSSRSNEMDSVGNFTGGFGQNAVSGAGRGANIAGYGANAPGAVGIGNAALGSGLTSVSGYSPGRPAVVAPAISAPPTVSVPTISTPPTMSVPTTTTVAPTGLISTPESVAMAFGQMDSIGLAAANDAFGSLAPSPSALGLSMGLSPSAAISAAVQGQSLSADPLGGFSPSVAMGRSPSTLTGRGSLGTPTAGDFTTERAGISATDAAMAGLVGGRAQIDTLGRQGTGMSGLGPRSESSLAAATGPVGSSQETPGWAGTIASALNTVGLDNINAFGKAAADSLNATRSAAALGPLGPSIAGSVGLHAGALSIAQQMGLLDSPLTSPQERSYDTISTIDFSENQPAPQPEAPVDLGVIDVEAPSRASPRTRDDIAEDARTVGEMAAAQRARDASMQMAQEPMGMAADRRAAQQQTLGETDPNQQSSFSRNQESSFQQGFQPGGMYEGSPGPSGRGGAEYRGDARQVGARQAAASQANSEAVVDAVRGLLEEVEQGPPTISFPQFQRDVPIPRPKPADLAIPPSAQPGLLAPPVTVPASAVRPKPAREALEERGGVNIEPANLPVEQPMPGSPAANANKYSVIKKIRDALQGGETRVSKSEPGALTGGDPAAEAAQAAVDDEKLASLGGSPTSEEGETSGQVPFDTSLAGSFRDRGSIESVSALVFHHTGGRTAGKTLANGMKARGVGVQFAINRDGSIQLLTKEPNSIAAHTSDSINNLRWAKKGNPRINRRTAIGVEIVAKNDADVTQAQIEAAARLAAWASKQPWAGEDFMVVGHGAYQGDEGAAEAVRAGRFSKKQARQADEGKRASDYYNSLSDKQKAKLLDAYMAGQLGGDIESADEGAALSEAEAQGLLNAQQGIPGENSWRGPHRQGPTSPPQNMSVDLDKAEKIGRKLGGAAAAIVGRDRVLRGVADKLAEQGVKMNPKTGAISIPGGQAQIDKVSQKIGVDLNDVLTPGSKNQSRLASAPSAPNVAETPAAPIVGPLSDLMDGLMSENMPSFQGVNRQAKADRLDIAEQVDQVAEVAKEAADENGGLIDANQPPDAVVAVDPETKTIVLNNGDVLSSYRDGGEIRKKKVPAKRKKAATREARAKAEAGQKSLTPEWWKKWRAGAGSYGILGAEPASLV